MHANNEIVLNSGFSLCYLRTSFTVSLFMKIPPYYGTILSPNSYIRILNFGYLIKD